MALREYNFDGLVGPTHNYAGLSPGNIAATTHSGEVSNPREAALQGLKKMQFVAELGAGQAVLPPQPRPSLTTLRRLGFAGTDEQVISAAAKHNDQLLRLCSSAASMWTANAATCAPATDTADRRMHVTPANLQAMFHRAIEAETTHAVLRAIFADERHFAVHEPLPGGGQFADEGAANHTRLFVAGRPAVHIFAWGRSAYREADTPRKYPARQTLEASEALARLHQIAPARCLFPQQSPPGIDAGAFHTDVLAVGNANFFLLHERAFVDVKSLLDSLRRLLGDEFQYALASESELPATKAVAAYPFNSQLLTLPGERMVLIAPVESASQPEAKRFIDRLIAENNPVTAVHYLDVRQSMNNGGGPACLRLRVVLSDEDAAAVTARVFFTPGLHGNLAAWVGKHYRDRLAPADLRDPALARESMTALDQLTQILNLGSIYDFQRAPHPGGTT
jgi:succinylarginine dihydrolase